SFRWLYVEAHRLSAGCTAPAGVAAWFDAHGRSGRPACCAERRSVATLGESDSAGRALSALVHMFPERGAGRTGEPRRLAATRERLGQQRYATLLRRGAWLRAADAKALYRHALHLGQRDAHQGGPANDGLRTGGPRAVSRSPPCRMGLRSSGSAEDGG